jgi:hypothetical protein
MTNSHSVNFFWREPEIPRTLMLNTGTVTLELGGYNGVTIFINNIKCAESLQVAVEEAVNLFKIKQLEGESA